MSEPSLLLLRNTLRDAAEDDRTQPPHARAFAAWVQHKNGGRNSLLESLSAEAMAAQGPLRQTAHAAVLGFASSIDSSLTDHFLQSVDWLSARQYFAPGRPLSFEVDGIALLGVAVGLWAANPERSMLGRTWLRELLRRTLQTIRTADWNETLIRTADQLLTAAAEDDFPKDIFPDLCVALCSKNMMRINAAIRADAWDMISRLAAEDMTRAATQVCALAYLLRDTAAVRLEATTIEDVARLLAGVQRSMKRWTWETAPRTPKSSIARWTVENEYHVQDMLWSILAPIFPDLDDEEWLKSLGPHHPRADLAIPSLRLIVEVKFLRRNTASALSDVIQQVAADAATYLQEDGAFQHIIAFVWDNTATTEQHAELRQGLNRIRGVRDAVILPRPQKMMQVTSLQSSERE
ncbi:hypothetical protein [Bradyrhizobium oligotrophicum]|uniref:PD-(D/E)XK nuclease domain-containing protein n=1 Tax=Bradyrhizobium oligotrophicum TaxID=44255 RepID=UPI003EBAE7D3